MRSHSELVCHLSVQIQHLPHLREFIYLLAVDCKQIASAAWQVTDRSSWLGKAVAASVQYEKFTHLRNSSLLLSSVKFGI